MQDTHHLATGGFKCCKSKVFNNYVCTKCLNVFHKSCVLRSKSNFKLIEGFKIICCENMSETYNDIDEEWNTLQESINDLKLDNEVKTKYINKLKIDNEKFIREALTTEEELNELIKKQKVTINEMAQQINDLSKTISLTNNRSIRTVAIQTSNLTTKTTESQTASSEELTYTSTSTQTTHQVDIKRVADSSSVREPEVTDLLKSSKLFKMPTDKRILLLTDQYGKGLSSLMRGTQELADYNISSIVKPSASFQSITEDIVKLTSDFSKNDFVIIIAGTNDLRSKQYPFFRGIWDKLKTCLNTNIILASVPYGRNRSIDWNIHKFNSKLQEFLKKINDRYDAHFSSITLNTSQSRVINKLELVKSFMKAITNLNSVVNSVNSCLLNQSVPIMHCTDSSPIITLDDTFFVCDDVVEMNSISSHATDISLEHIFLV